MSEPSYQHRVTARLKEYIEPIDRGDRYEDPLSKILGDRGLGRVTGGGTQLSKNWEIVAVDLELELANLDTALELAKDTLEFLGAPVGSELVYGHEGVEKRVPFGSQEGVALYLDGVSLPQEVYAESDFSEICRVLAERLEQQAAGSPRSVWSGAEETAIYIYGPDAGRIAHIIVSLSPEIPLFQNARLVYQRRGGAEDEGERRLPRRDG